MSERSITIRRTDLAIREAFKIALAQYGVRLVPDMPFIKIVGNKQYGCVTVSTKGCAGDVVLRISDENFYYFIQVKITRMYGEELSRPRVVRFEHSGGILNNLMHILSEVTAHRNIVAYELVKFAQGYDVASSLRHHIWEYPEVDVKMGYIVLRYEVPELQISELVLWYNSVSGFFRGELDGSEFDRDPLTGEWSRA